MLRPRRWIAVAVLLGAYGIPRAASQAQVQIDINRPHSPFQCDTPIGEKWYGSTERCLDELCGGKNVYNEWIFDDDKRRRRNPCYGRNPTDFTGH
jgi:hypothetical protein